VLDVHINSVKTNGFPNVTWSNKVVRRVLIELESLGWRSAHCENKVAEVLTREPPWSHGRNYSIPQKLTTMKYLFRVTNYMTHNGAVDAKI
jgi:hypothetical protein